MTNIDTPNPGRRRIGDTLGRNLAGQNPPHVSIQGNRFTLVDATNQKRPVETFDPKTGPFLDCIIIDALEHSSRIFWGKDKSYDPGNISPPLCFSNNGVAPSANAQQPQSPTCASCQWSDWNSAVSNVTGKGIPACSKNQNIALLAIGQPEMCFLLRVPPKSLKALGNYNGRFVGKDFAIDDVVTRIDFEPGVVGTLRFNPIRRAEADETQARDTMLDSGRTDAIVGRGDRPYAGAMLAAQPAPQQIAAPAQQAAPKQDTEMPWEAPQQKASPDQGKRGPGRPKKADVQPQQQTASAPAQQGGNGFGIQAPAQPDPGVTKMVDDFFGT